MDREFSVSVVIPAYNEAPRMKRALDSVLKQTYPVSEIIVIDDGSTDGTADVVAEFDQVVCIRQKNQGLSAARNRGIQEAKYDWVALLDGDDEWFPGHIENAKRVLEQNPEIMWLCAAFERRLENGKVIFNSYVAPFMVTNDIIDNYFIAEARTSFSRPSSMIVKRSVFDKIGLFNVEINSFGEDLDMWYRIACQYPKIGYVQDPGCVYWEKKNSITTAKADIPRFLRRIEITQKSGSVKSNMENPEGPAYLIQHWLVMALKSAIKHQDRSSMDILDRQFSGLLPVFWRPVAKVLKNDLMLRIAHAGLQLRGR